ncbi:MAG: PAS domain S-box protein, partial [Microcoleus sp.]
RNSEAKFRSIIENLNDIVYIITPDGTFNYVSSQFKNITGYEIANLLGRSFAQFVHPEDLQVCETALQRTVRGEKLRDIEYRVLHQNGNYYWHSSNLSALESDSNEVASCLGIARYIHDRKQAEIALIESNSRWHLAIEAAGDGTWDWNIKNNQIIFSRQWKAMLGYAEDEIANELTEWESRLHPDDREQCYEDVDKHLKGETSVYRSEHRLRCKDGTYKWILDRGQVVEWDKDGQPLRFVGTHCDISDRKVAETLLQQSQKRYETLAEASPIGVFYTDKNASNHYVNQRAMEMTGLTREEALGNGWASVLHPEDRDRVFSEWEQSLQTNQSFHSEYRFLRPDGTVIWVIGQTLAVQNDSGEIEGFVGTLVNITDRKQAEIELAGSQAELMALFNAIKDVIIVLNAEGRLLKIAQSSAPLLYRPSAEVLGKTIHEIFPQDMADVFLKTIHEAIEVRALTRLEYSLPIGDRLVCFDASVSPMSDDLVVWVARDITDSKHQEQALRLIVEGTAAKTGADFFKSCVQYMAQVLEVRYALIAEVIDSENSIAKTLAFWAGDDFADNFTYSLIGAPCEKSQKEFCLYRNSVQHLFPEDADLVTLQVESYSGLPILDVARNRLGFMAVMDTKPMEKAVETQSAILRIFATRTGAEIERMQAEATVRRSEIQLRQQTQELETTLKKLQNTQTQLIQAEKMSSLGQLVAGIAHEINNPVSFIYSNIQPATDYASNLIELSNLYQEHYPNPPQTIADFRKNIDFEYLASDFYKLLISMKTGATRISDIVKSLRTFSRLDEADLKAIDIHENIDSTLVLLQNRLNGRAGTPEVNVIKNYGNSPSIECYGGLLNQVLMNLLVNAIDAIEERRNKLEKQEKFDYVGQIAIATSRISSDRVCISIQDNGCGMTPQVQEKIFNPFFTTKPVGKGTGMGLATSYQIVTENHRGDLQCFSLPGEGTLFAITLPIQASMG